jgi:arylsulfatase A-like enzyme
MRPSRRDFLKHLGLGAAGLAAVGMPFCKDREHAVQRPNILLITADYQCGRDGPSLGHDFLDMPALDRLCREGAVFERYFSTAPICMPARYTIITGQYPHTHGEQDNRGRWVPEESPILMEHLRRAGYTTIGIGKMHFHPWERMAGYHRRIIADRKGNSKRDNERLDDYAGFLARHGLTRWDYLRYQWNGKYPGVYDWPFDDSLHIDAYVGDRTREVIERDELPSPWFMWVSFNGPHNPWDPPERFARPYRNMTLPLGKTFPGELRTKPKDHTRLRYNYTPQVVDRLDADPQHRDEVLHAIRAGHYGNLTFIDRQMEGIFTALEKKGQLDKTVIMYSSDHGSHLGDHNLIHKGTHYDASARVPLVVRHPDLVKPRRLTAFAGHVDMMPTILSLAGAPIPPEVEGHNLFPLLSGRADSIQDHAVIEIRNGTSIVTDRWKMGIYPRDGNEGDLYDLEADPDELKNLFDVPEYKPVREDLLGRMQAANPELAADMEREWVKPPPQRSFYKFKAGDEVRRGEAPIVAGKGFVITALVESAEPEKLSGVLLAQPGSRPINGYAFYLKNGRTAFAVRHWGEIFVVTAPENLPSGKVEVEARLGADGNMSLKVGGVLVASGKAPGPIPVRPGRITGFSAERLLAGGQKAGAVVGDYSVPNTFNGRIHRLSLSLSD